MASANLEHPQCPLLRKGSSDCFYGISSSDFPLLCVGSSDFQIFFEMAPEYSEYSDFSKLLGDFQNFENFENFRNGFGMFRISEFQNFQNFRIPEF